jgi:hypothetical protein
VLVFTKWPILLYIFLNFSDTLAADLLYIKKSDNSGFFCFPKRRLGKDLMGGGGFQKYSIASMISMQNSYGVTVVS